MFGFEENNPVGWDVVVVSGFFLKGLVSLSQKEGVGGGSTTGVWA